MRSGLGPSHVAKQTTATKENRKLIEMTLAGCPCCGTPPFSLFQAVPKRRGESQRPPSRKAKLALNASPTFQSARSEQHFQIETANNAINSAAVNNEVTKFQLLSRGDYEHLGNSFSQNERHQAGANA